MVDEKPASAGWDPEQGEFADIVTTVNFVADAGKLMLESSTSVSEVVDRLRRFLDTIGISSCALDATLSSLILSYWHHGMAMPITTMREVHVGSPRLELMAGTEGLLERVEKGTVGIPRAAKELRSLARTPPPGKYRVRLGLLVSVVGWVAFVDGLQVLTILVALLATLLTFPSDELVRRIRLPPIAATFLAAAVVAAIPNLLAAAGVSLRVGPAVVGGLFIYLPGRAFVSSVVDGLANAPISSISRGIQAVLTAGMLALGMLVGSTIGEGLGLTFKPDAATTPLVVSVVGAGLGVLGLAWAWAMPRPQLVPTLLISTVGWSIVAIFTRSVTSSGWPVYVVAAGVVGLAGGVVGLRQRVPASVYTGVAILPLVPGFKLYNGMLAVAEGKSAAAFSALGEAGVISLAIATGVAVGLALGHDAISVGTRIVRRGAPSG